MKKVTLLALVFLCFGLTAQAQLPPPLNISGTATQVTGHQSGDPVTNGAVGTSSTSVNFTATSTDTGLFGSGTALGGVFATNVVKDNSSFSGFSAKGTADTTLKLGESGQGNFSLSGLTQGQAYSNTGDCTANSCAGAGAVGTAGLNLNGGSTTGGTIGGNALLNTSGVTYTKTGENFSFGSAQVTSGLCLTPVNSTNTTLPCPSGSCGG